MDTYKVIRFYQNDSEKREVIKTGLTLEEAQEHCNNPQTSSSTASGRVETASTAVVGPWFGGYEKE